MVRHACELAEVRHGFITWARRCPGFMPVGNVSQRVQHCDRIHGGMWFVQLSAGSALPAPLWDDNSETQFFDAILFCQKPEEGTASSDRCKQAWRKIVCCILRGDAPPEGMVILAAFIHRKIATSYAYPVEELVALAWSSSECTALRCYDDGGCEGSMTVCGGLSCSYFRDVVVRAAKKARRKQDFLRSFRHALFEGRLDGWQDNCELQIDTDFMDAHHAAQEQHVFGSYALLLASR